MKVNLFSLLIIIFTVLFLVGCAQQAAVEEVQVKEAGTEAAEHETAEESSETAEETQEIITLTWTGCGISKKAYMTEAAAEYEKLTGVRIDVTGGGATKGIRSASGGTTDIGGTCRHSLPDLYPGEEGDALLTHVAWDALVFFTHPDNPVDGVTTDEAKAILTGAITNWNEVGGPDAKIIPVFREQTESGKISGVGYSTRLMLFNDPETEYTETAVFFPSTGPVEEYVENTEYTFAVSGFSSAKKRNVKLLGLDGQLPTKENIASGSYPHFRPLYLATKGEPEGETKNFIDWILSDGGQDFIGSLGTTVTLKEGAGLKEAYQFWPADTSLIRNY